MIRSEYAANVALQTPAYRYTVRKVAKKPAPVARVVEFTRVKALLSLAVILPAMLAASLYL